jgi:hypothetical protein
MTHKYTDRVENKHLDNANSVAMEELQLPPYTQHERGDGISKRQ